MSANRVIEGTPRATRQWTVTYNQGDVDFIREQIEQTESSKRRILLVVFLLTLAGLVGALFLLSSVYREYRLSEANQARIAQEATALQARFDQTQRQLDAANAAVEKEAKQKSDGRAKLDKLLPIVMSGGAGYVEIANFARLVNRLPSGSLELTGKPPDNLFRNWKFSDGQVNEVYALVGGFVDGKWTVSSNLISRRGGTATP